MKKKRKETFVSLFLGDAFDDDLIEENTEIDDTTFNELNDRTKDLTDELNELFEKVDTQPEEELEEEEKEIIIESSFPKIDKLGSVVPHKVEIEQ